MGLLSSRPSNPIYEGAVEEVMRTHGNPSLALTGTLHGLSFQEWENEIRTNLREPMFGTPRCLRFRRWNLKDRLSQILDSDK